jgi:hypothetical protein
MKTTKPAAKKKPATKKKTAAKAKTASRGLTEAQFKKIALGFPGTSEGSSYGSPAILFQKKFFTRLRAEDKSLVLFVGSIDERDMLIEAEPRTFHITDHYKNYPTVLARLEYLDAATLEAMLERRWRQLAPKKLLKEI